MEDEVKNEVTYTENVSVEGNMIVITKTPDVIQAEVTTINIEEVKARLEKNTNAMLQWKALVDADQAIIDKYETIYKLNTENYDAKTNA